MTNALARVHKDGTRSPNELCTARARPAAIPSIAAEPCGYQRSFCLVFGHGAAGACCPGTGWVCIDPLELSASVHDVEIAVLGAVDTAK